MIVTIRDVWQEDITKASEFAEQCALRFEKCEENVRNPGARHHGKLRKWHMFWNWAIWCPITVFFLCAFGATGHALYVCWSKIPTEQDWWQPYRWVLLITLILDFVSIILMLVSKRCVRLSHIELQDWITQADKESVTPKTIIVTTGLSRPGN